MNLYFKGNPVDSVVKTEAIIEKNCHYPQFSSTLLECLVKCRLKARFIKECTYAGKWVMDGTHHPCD